MKIINAALSPFGRKVMVVLEEAGQRSQIEYVDGMGSPVAPNPDVLAANPVGKIPCLVLDDGTSMYDSRVITRYLDSLYNLSLYPTGDQAWTTLTLEAHVDAMLDAAVLCVYETRCRDEGDRSIDWKKGQQDKISRALDALENNWMTHLNGKHDIGHIGVGCALEYLDFRAEMGGWDDWRTNRPNLTKWGKEFSERPSMKATVPS